MESIQDERKRDLEKAKRLWGKVEPKAETEDFDEATVEALKEAMELFERWDVKEKMAEVYRHWGMYQHLAGNYEVGITYAKKNLDIRLELHEEAHIEVAKAYQDLGLHHMKFHQINLAEEYTTKALNITLKISGGNNEIVINHYIILSCLQAERHAFLNAKNLVQKALTAFQKLPNKNTELLLQIYNNLAANYGDFGDYPQAEKYLLLALKTILNLPQLHIVALLHTYYNLGVISRRIGDYQKAHYYIQKSLRLENNEIEKIDIYDELAGIAHDLSNYSKAITYGETALAIIQRHHIHHHSSLPPIYLMLSFVYSRQGNKKKALWLLDKALKATILKFGKDHVSMGMMHFNFGQYYIKVEEPAKAKIHLEKSLLIFQKKKDVRQEFLSSLLYEWGNLFLIQKQYLQAIQHYHKSLRIYLNHSFSEDIYTHPFLTKKINLRQIKVENPYGYRNLIAALHKKAEAFQAYYQQDTQYIRDLEAANQSYWAIIRLTGHLRQSFLSEQSKLAIVRNLQEPLAGAVSAAYLRFEVLPNSHHLEHLFLLMEKGKAYLLLQHNQEKSQQKNLGIPPNLLEQEQQLKRKLAFLEKSIQFQEQKGEKAEKELLGQWKEESFDTYDQFEKLKQQLETDYPDYHRQNYSTDTVSIPNLQSSLQENQTVLNYFIGEEKIYLFAITSDEYEVFATDKPSNWTNLIQNYLQSIKFHQKTEFLRHSFELYQILLQEAIHHIIDPFGEEGEQRQIFIIPHAELHYLPFETLIVSESEETTPYSDLDYLLKNCQISYHYSTTLLHLDLQKQAESAERAPTDVAFTGFAPVYTSSSNAQKQALELLQKEYATAANRSKAVRSDGTWMPLPYSKLEVENIAQLFEEHGLQNQAFLYESANKSNLEEQIGKSRFVLIAAHGIVNNQYPELSGLVLAEDGSGKFKSDTTEELEEFEADRSKIELQKATDDCILNMKEVAMIPMNADLVVLSSCESGIGELHKGEGMMAVNRGFLASGAKNVVSTLFKVNDRASSELTTLLFRYILKGEGYSSALQRAKLELLKKEGMSPKAWSGFVLFGAGV